MSNTFQVGKQYKLEETIALGMQAMVNAVFKDEVGVFTVHEINEVGDIYTDDITSDILTSRCKFPAEAIHMVEEVVNG